jgi:hypothetical protein
MVRVTKLTPPGVPTLTPGEEATEIHGVYEGTIEDLLKDSDALVRVGAFHNVILQFELHYVTNLTPGSEQPYALGAFLHKLAGGPGRLADVPAWSNPDLLPPPTFDLRELPPAPRPARVLPQFKPEPYHPVLWWGGCQVLKK